MSMLEITGIILIALSLASAVSVAVGMIRSKNSYTLIHIASVSDAIGIAFSLFGAALIMFSKNMSFEARKVLLLLLFVYIMNPLCSYAFAKVLYFYKKTPMENSLSKKKKG